MSKSEAVIWIGAMCLLGGLVIMRMMDEPASAPANAIVRRTWEQDGVVCYVLKNDGNYVALSCMKVKP